MSVSAGGRRTRVRAWLGASLAGLGVLLAAMLAVATNLATPLLPGAWGWARDPVLAWGVVAGLVILMAAAAVVSSMLAGDAPGSDTAPRQHVEQAMTALSGGMVVGTASGPVVGTNSGNVFTGPVTIHSAAPAQPAPPPQPAATGNLPPRNPHFTGRSALLREVSRSLGDGPVAVTAIQGLGGVGKSQVALEVAYRGRDRGDYQLTWWLRAESPLTLVEDLASLAPALGVPVAQERERTVAGVLAALQRRDRWLLVFDNAPNGDEIRRWLPGGSGHILITSRERAWTGLARSVRVEEFSRTESVEYLAKQEPAAAAPHGELTTVFGDLAAMLGDLPLALAQAAAYLTRHGLSAAGYLRLYQDQEAAARLLAAGIPGYPHSVATTWLVHFVELADRNPAALELLRFCAFLDPDDINLELLLSRPDLLAGRLTGRLAEVSKNPPARLEIVGELAATGLVTRLGDLRVRVHRLVGQVTRQQLAAGDAEAQRSWSGHIIRLVGRLFPDESWDPISWPVCADLAAHVVALTEHEAPAAWAAFALDHLGRYLEGRGEYEDAIVALQRAVTLKEAAFGSDYSEIATSLNSLGIVQRQLGQFEDAQSTLDRAVAIAKAGYGPRHPTFALILTSRGALDEQRGRPHQARARYRRALAILESAGASDHPDMALVLGSLGNVLRALGDFDGARTSYERALAIFTAAYGSEHFAVAVALTNLSGVQAELNQIEEARRSITRALDIKQAVFRPDHPEVAYALIILGSLQLKVDAFADARASLRRALEIQEAAYGLKHPEMAATLNNLGMVEAELGAFDDARDHWQRASAIFENAYGPAHPQARRLRKLLDRGWNPGPDEDSPDQLGE